MIQDEQKQTIAQRYEELSSLRVPYLTAARRYSKYTIPTVMPEEGWTDISSLPTPYAALPAQACISLASKFTSTLFPPTEAWFIMSPSDKVQRSPEYQQSSDLKDGLKRQLSNMTSQILARINGGNSRATISEAMTHLVICGNGLLYQPDDGDLKFFSLDKYVIKRDGDDHVYEIITKESIAYKLLPDNIQKAIDSKEKDKQADASADVNYDPSQETDPQYKNYTLYTRVMLTDGSWHVTQEVNGIKVEGEHVFPKEACPWIVLRLYKSSGSNYGPSYVSNYFGYIAADENLNYAMRTGASVLAKIIYTVKRGGMTNLNDIANAINGAVIYGDADNEVSTITSKGKPTDLSIAQQYLDRIEQRLSQAFLMPLGSIRDSERTTAEEVKGTWQELEELLNNAFIMLATEFQTPYLKRLIKVMQKTGELDSFKETLVDIKLTTGLTALGRRAAVTRKLEFCSQMVQLLTPQVFEKYVKVPELFADVADDYQVLSQGWLKSAAEIQQEEQQQMQQAMASQLIDKGAGPAINQMGQAYQQQQQIAADQSAQADENATQQEG